MDVTLCLASAYESLNEQRLAMGDRLPVDPCERRAPIKLNRTRITRAGGTPPAEHVRDLVERTSGLALPAHVLVDGGSSHRSTGHRIVHTTGPLPPKSLVRIKDNLFASSPEHLFMQASRKLDAVELAWLGCELTATYAQHPRLGGGQVPARPLTSTERLRTYLENALEMGAPGSRRALDALKRVVEGAASSAEIAWALLMTLPYAMGGRAIPKPQLNYRAPLDLRGVAVRGREYVSCDACWPKEGLVVEYNSDAYHLDPTRQAKDNDKLAALEQAGYQVIPVSTKQHTQLALADDAIKRIGNRLGVRNRENTCGYDWQARRSALRIKLHKLMTAGIDWTVFDRKGAAREANG